MNCQYWLSLQWIYSSYNNNYFVWTWLFTEMHILFHIYLTLLSYLRDRVMTYVPGILTYTEKTLWCNLVLSVITLPWEFKCDDILCREFVLSGINYFQRVCFKCDDILCRDYIVLHQPLQQVQKELHPAGVLNVVDLCDVTLQSGVQAFL